MTAILGGHLAQKRRPPERCEARPLRQGRDASEACGDKHGAARAVDGDVMDIEVPGRAGHLRYVQPVVSLVLLAGHQQVFESPELVERAKPEGLSIGPETHGSIERALEHGK